MLVLVLGGLRLVLTMNPCPQRRHKARSLRAVVAPLCLLRATEEAGCAMSLPDTYHLQQQIYGRAATIFTRYRMTLASSRTVPTMAIELQQLFGICGTFQFMWCTGILKNSLLFMMIGGSATCGSQPHRLMRNPIVTLRTASSLTSRVSDRLPYCSCELNQG